MTISIIWPASWSTQDAAEFEHATALFEAVDEDMWK
ncbi:MAG: hypothetical protein CSYNP_02908 [Syntrophus sp. SKADARSKE-3]|nr:hypothetical protein [Syntrophus sp. SKADARSKE-3]